MDPGSTAGISKIEIANVPPGTELHRGSISFIHQREIYRIDFVAEIANGSKIQTFLETCMPHDVVLARRKEIDDEIISVLHQRSSAVFRR